MADKMKRLARFALAVVILFVLSLIWNGVVHLVILRRANEAVQHLRRTDLPGALGWSLLLTGLVSILFVWGYIRTARTGMLREGLAYGLFIGLLVALLVDVNQYLLYPLPFTLVVKWFAGGVLEFTFYGAVVSLVFRARTTSPAA
jgi:hypothetical protein